MFRLISLTLVILLTSSCGNDVTAPEQRIRPVKTILVAERASGQLRKFPGKVEPLDSSSLSFEVSGLVQEVLVDGGDRFEKGQALAVLDKQQFELNVEAARAALSRAEAQNSERQSAYDRQLRMQAQDAGATTQRAIDQARASYESTRESISYSRAQLSLAKRDLQSTELRAPYAGVVSAKQVEPSEQVSRGQPVFDVFVEGAMEAAVSVPENMIGGVYIGLKGEVRLPNQPEVAYAAVVSRVGSAATSANAFPVDATILAADELVRPGMTAELTLMFAFEDDDRSGYLVPIQAVAPGLAIDDRHIYLFDPDTSSVRKTAVKAKGLVGNQIIITAGVSPGDVVVVAGVPFLRDGQKVKLMNSSHGGAQAAGEEAEGNP
jgi:multidrug efflux system membrane fusion protein